ncbi:MAG: MFS transporter [Minisyncoccota bacterium]
MYVAKDLTASKISGVGVPPIAEAVKPLKSLPVFIANFFFSLHFATTLYVNSSFLGSFFSPTIVGLLYIAGAIGNAIFFLNASRILSKIGSRGFLLLFLSTTFISTIGIALSTTEIFAALFFFLYASVSLMIYYAFDLILEELSVNHKTGEIRGLYLTIANTAIMGGPVLVAIIGEANNFSNLYITSAILLLPIFILSISSLKMSKEDEQNLPVPLPFSTWAKLPNVHKVTLARTVLEFFFAVMVIYMPVYLHEVIGFGWREIGLIFIIMLLPFVLFEWPAGELADRKYGEKEIMSFGFLLLGLSAFIMPFLGKTFLVWAGVLFLSRVGASLIEVMTESYFFKQVGVHNIGLISIFRLSRPVGTMLGSLAGIISVSLLPQGTIFYVLAVIVFLGLREATLLVDTK